MTLDISGDKTVMEGEDDPEIKVRTCGLAARKPDH